MDKDCLLWHSLGCLAKERRKEELRRFRSYLTTMGITGQLLLLLQLLFERPASCTAVHTFLRTLPDQDVLASQKHSGLALPDNNYHFSDRDRGNLDSILAGTFVDPSFLETFFTTFPWQILPDYMRSSIQYQLHVFLEPSKRRRRIPCALIISSKSPAEQSTLG